MPLFRSPPPQLISSKENPPVQGGAGSLQATYNIGASVAGNSRGVGAVDLQQSRNSATEVASGLLSTIGGGISNTASGYYATVGGGKGNTASGYNSTVGGGWANTASSTYAMIGGGLSNTASVAYATVGGGYNNDAIGIYSTVGGGNGNTASNNYATVGGGYANTASGVKSTVGGGFENTASQELSTVGGGISNTASGYNATVGGGFSNTASANNATVGGGSGNTASNYYATVGGGISNTASGYYATVTGGGRGLADRYGMSANASGKFSAQGDAQAVEFIARNVTTGTTTQILMLDGSTTRFTIRNNTVLSGICTISGFSTTGAKVGLYQRSICISNVGGTTVLQHSSTIGTDHETDSSWNVTITADNTNDALQILCLGSTGDTVRWVAVFRGLEIGMP